MTAVDADRLYALLPAIHRIRDEQQGGPLRALVALVAQEFTAIDENLEQLYDDQFIETCQDWVAPYLGDLIGYRPLHGASSSPTSAMSSPRAEVANTIGYRRRKGTAAMLEQLARDVTDWPARAVEFFEQLATTQYLNHVRLHAPATASLRALPALRRIDGPFNTLAHTAEVRDPERGAGRWNIPNVGLHLWRLRAYPLSDVPLTPDPSDPTRRFRFDPLGADRPLFRRARTEATVRRSAGPLDVPGPIELRTMADDVEAATLDADVPCDYGPTASVVLAHPDPVPGRPPLPIPIDAIRVCDLRDVPGGWAHEATLPATTVAIDPRLGRVLVGSAVPTPIVATFRTGFSRAIGGGEYERAPTAAPSGPELHARGGEALQPHLDAVAGGGRLVVDDSLRYAETPVFEVDATLDPAAPGAQVVIAARNGARPLLAAGGVVELRIGARGTLTLDGLVIGGGTLQVVVAAGDDAPRSLVLRHCTLVPGLALAGDGTATSPAAPSLVVAHPFTTVVLESCIVGPLAIDVDKTVSLVDCIVDAGSPDAVAYRGVVEDSAGATMEIVDSTVVGKVHARSMTLASDTLFFARLAAADPWAAPLWIDRRQEGCLRFCRTPPGALLPRHFRCVAALPQFTSLRYGTAGYAQLRPATDVAIREGASDGGEIGVLHPLHQPQREANLRIRLDEYLRFGLRAGIFYAT